MDKVCLVHVPKSAGVTFLHLLREQVYGGKRTAEHFNDYTLGEETDVNSLNDYDLVVGHIDLADVEYALPRHKMVTILRHPVDRAISWYKYSQLISDEGINDINKNGNTIGTLHKSQHRLNQMYVHNTMTWMLGDHLDVMRRTVTPEIALEVAKSKIDNMDYVIFFSRLKEDILEYCHKYNHDVNIYKLPWVNPTAWIDAGITDKAVENLKECNKLDIELYEYALNSRRNR